MMADDIVYSIPQHVRDYVAKAGYEAAGDAMTGYINQWYGWMRADGDFYDYDDKDANGRRYKVHRRSMHPANRVAEEWASLLLNDNTVPNCGEQACTDWLCRYLERENFYALGQGNVQRAFAMGTAAWAVWIDTANRDMRLRRYDARMVLPLSWDDDGVTECAFCTKASKGGKRLDQVQMHVIDGGEYHIKTAFFDSDGNEVEVDGVIPDLPTKCATPTFAIVRPAIENTCVDMSPYGQSVFANAIDAIQAVDLAFDAIFNEIGLGKLRIFLSDMMFDTTKDDTGEQQAVPFGKDDAVVFRKVSSADDMIKEFAPDLRTEAQVRALRTALQVLGDLVGFGIGYFDIDESGGIKTATEVSSENSALMRNIRKHENLLEGALAQLFHAALHCAREFLGEELPDEGEITINFDDSIITDTAAEKAQDMAEVGVTMNAWEYRAKWYGEDETAAKANAPGFQREGFLED